MTVYLGISLPKVPCMHRIHMVLANPRYDAGSFQEAFQEVFPFSLHVFVACMYEFTWQVPRKAMYIAFGVSFARARSALSLGIVFFS